jgi:hypothetical protein
MSVEQSFLGATDGNFQNRMFHSVSDDDDAFRHFQPAA